MKKFIFLLVLFLPFYAQDDIDDLDDDAEATEVNFDVECSFNKGKTPFDDFKYENNIQMGMKIWYSDAYTSLKKWRKEKDANRKKTYADKIIESSWKLIKSDPEGKSIKKLKRRGTVKRIVLVAERLGEVYIQQKNAEMLGTLLAHVKDFIGNSSKLNKYAVTYYNSTNNKVCEAKQYKAWIATIEKNEANKKNLKALYKGYLTTLIQLGAKDKAIEVGEEYLAFDPNDSEILDIVNGQKGDPYEILDSYRAKLSKNPNDKNTIERAAPLAASLDENEDAYKWLKILLKDKPSDKGLLTDLTKVSYKLGKYKEAISYGKNLTDADSRVFVIKSYIERGQFKSAYNIAATVQRGDNESGHYLKGLVYEETAKAAQGDFKDFEWRLIYRLANIEYLYGGSVGRNRAKSVNRLIPTKGAIFLKANRIKPKAGKFSKWITWQKIYDKKIYGPDL